MVADTQHDEVVMVAFVGGTSSSFLRIVEYGMTSHPVGLNPGLQTKG